jgi:hypothetical protein
MGNAAKPSHHMAQFHSKPMEGKAYFPNEVAVRARKINPSHLYRRLFKDSLSATWVIQQPDERIYKHGEQERIGKEVVVDHFKAVPAFVRNG